MLINAGARFGDKFGPLADWATFATLDLVIAVGEVVVMSGIGEYQRGARCQGGGVPSDKVLKNEAPNTLVRSS